MVEARPTANEVLYVEREHAWHKQIFMCCGISLCITVDILQYSMPLAFLPSVLEDRGHEAFEIATAIGVYYWTGFLGCSIIMMYQVWRMMYQRDDSANTEHTTLSTVQRHLWYLIVGLGVGAITLCIQAMHPSLTVHTTCRFIQGFCGAFIFFYTALLNVALFTGRQQDMAVTFGSCALNVAEVFGSFLGAVLFNLWGQSSVFWFLGVVSIINQAMLFGILQMVTGNVGPSISRRSTPLSQRSTHTPPLGDADAGGGPVTLMSPDMACCGTLPPPQPGSVQKLQDVFSSRPLACAVLLIGMSAVVKGSVEEMLPFHADHRWGYNPIEIGRLFCIIAIAYILAAAFCCHVWEELGTYQVLFSAHFLLFLGIVAWMVFAVVTYFNSANILTLTLMAYGVCLGLTHTPANLLAASVIDNERGAAKDASNGVFQTMWEAGGSLGFLLGGLLAARYHEQMGLLTGCAMGCVAVSILMVTIWTWPEDGCDCVKDRKKQQNYGSTASA